MTWFCPWGQKREVDVMEHFNPLLLHNDSPAKFITIGEVMLRLTPPNYEKIRMASNFEASYGGSEANIALALANLGVDSTFFSVVPNNSLGKSAVRWLRSNDVHCTPMILPPRMKPRPTVWAPITWKPVMASAPARLLTTASTPLLLSMTFPKWIWTPCWTALTGCIFPALPRLWARTAPIL